jgi:hypothetical protein
MAAMTGSLRAHIIAYNGEIVYVGTVDDASPHRSLLKNGGFALAAPVHISP